VLEFRFRCTTPRRAPQPSDDVTVHVVLNDYGKLGYEETDRVKARPIGAAAGRRAGNSAPGRSFTVVRFIFTALPFLTRPKGTPANILMRSAMVLSGRAAQDMEAGSSSFPGVGASGRTPIRRLRPAESSRADHPPCPACHLLVRRAALGVSGKMERKFPTNVFAEDPLSDGSAKNFGATRVLSVQA
jgi:hypothetical protein